MSNRIAPLEPLPTFEPLRTRKRGKSRRREGTAPVKVRPMPTGHLTDEVLNDRAALTEYLKGWCLRIAKELAARNKQYGVSASDVRIEGARRGLWLNSQFKDRTFYFLGQTMKDAGLVGTGRTRRSDVEGARNMNQIYVLEEFAGRAE